MVKANSGTFSKLRSILHYMLQGFVESLGGASIVVQTWWWIVTIAFKVLRNII